jgi:protoheme ferro-lyase
VWSDTEEVAYQAGATDERAALLARLQEPDVREAVARALCSVRWLNGKPDADWLQPDADAALTKIAEMLK